MFPQFIFGRGKVYELGGILKSYRPRKIFLVTGKSSFNNLFNLHKIEEPLADFNVIRYSDFSINPQFEDLINGANLIKDFKPDVIIAVGGGSVIDTAKLLSILPNSVNRIKEIITGYDKLIKRELPFIIIPTTGGSGSECTHFAVAYINKIKYSVASKDLLPDHAIIDSESTYSMSKKLTAITALDALCQAIESYWAVNATEESMKYASESIKLTVEVFERVVNQPDDESREKMMLAAHLAGKAINISKTTAPHALSYFLSMNYNIPHGHAVALTLGQFFIFHGNATIGMMSSGYDYQKLKNRITELCSLLNVETPYNVAQKIKLFLKSAKLATSLKEIGISSDEEINSLIVKVNLDRLKNNPVWLNGKDLQTVLTLDVDNFYK